MVAAAHPVGKLMARQEAMDTRDTTARGSMPPATAVLAAIGVRMATVPLLDMKVVITVATTVKTMVTVRPLGFSPNRLSTRLPIYSPAPDWLRAVENTSTPATIHTMSPVRPAMASRLVITPLKMKTMITTAGTRYT